MFFLKKDLDTEDLKILTQLLTSEIQREIHAVVKNRFEEIVDELNGMGHALKAYGEQQLCDLSYRDDWEDKSSYHCKLRVAFCSIISVGYTNSESS
jgi:hypothetical protein